MSLMALWTYSTWQSCNCYITRQKLRTFPLNGLHTSCWIFNSLDCSPMWPCNTVVTLKGKFGPTHNKQKLVRLNPLALNSWWLTLAAVFRFLTHSLKWLYPSSENIPLMPVIDSLQVWYTIHLPPMLSSTYSFVSWMGIVWYLNKLNIHPCSFYISCLWVGFWGLERYAIMGAQLF